MNLDYTVYDTITGKPLRVVSCPEIYAGHQAIFENEDIVTGHYDQTYRINLDTFEAEKLDVEYPEAPALRLLELQQYMGDDTLLNKAIINMGEDPSLFRVNNYKVFREWAYPPMVDYLDAQVKISSSDTAIISVGEQELAVYNQKCLNVKTRFPKEV